MRYSSLIFLLAALGCSVVAVYEKLRSAKPDGHRDFEIGQTDFALANVQFGSHESQTTITNPSAEPRRVLGIAGQCTGNFCISSAQSPPMLIQPGSSLALNCVLEVKSPSPIDAEIKIYLEENGIRTVTLRVTGNAVEAPRAPK